MRKVSFLLLAVLALIVLAFPVFAQDATLVPTLAPVDPNAGIVPLEATVVPVDPNLGLITTNDQQAFDDFNREAQAAVLPQQLERISWGAILAGTAIALMIQLALNLLGIAIGATSLNPSNNNDTDAGDVAEGAVIWIGMSTLVALFIGGWMAARFAGLPNAVDGMLHGLITWAIVTLFSLVLLTTAVGRIMSGVTSLIGHGLNLAGQAAGTVVQGAVNVAQGVAQGAVNVAQGAVNVAEEGAQNVVESNPELARATQNYDLSMHNLVEEARRALQQAGISVGSIEYQAQAAAADVRNAAQQAVRDPAQAGPTLESALQRIFQRSQGVMQQADRDALVRLMAERGNMPEPQARQMIAHWEETANQARTQLDQTRRQAEAKASELQHEIQMRAEQAKHDAERAAREAAEKTTSAVAKIAGAVFAAIVVGAFAAGLGGWIGSPEEIPVADIDTIPGE